MSGLMWHDLQWLLRRTPAKVLKEVVDRKGRLMIAGGCIRACIANEEINDIDLFACNALEAVSVANMLAPDQDRAKNDKGLLPGIHATDNAFTLTNYRPVVQLIHRWTFETPEQCIASFDFTIAQAAVWHDGNAWCSIVGERFYADLAAKRLIYTSPKRNEEPGGSLLRVLKFYQRGYRIPLDSFGAAIARMVKAVDFSKINNDEAQLAKVLTGLLREVDPNIDPKHIAHLPSESAEAEEAATLT
jgi:hypothetical protein